MILLDLVLARQERVGGSSGADGQEVDGRRDSYGVGAADLLGEQVRKGCAKMRRGFGAAKSNVEGFGQNLQDWLI